MSSKEMGLLTRAGKTSASTEYKLCTYYIDIYEMIEFLCGFLRVPFLVSSLPVHPTLRKLSPHHSRSRTKQVRFVARKHAKNSATHVSRYIIYDRQSATNELVSICVFARFFFAIGMYSIFSSIKFSRVKYQFAQFRLLHAVIRENINE